MEKAKTYKGIYSMHKYWSRKPFNIVDAYIKKYSNKNDLVLDSFCGSGVAVIEAVRNHRKGIGIDINPIAIKISKSSLKGCNINELNKCYNNLINKLEEEINSMYLTKCENCGNEKAIITHVIFENEKPTEVWYACGCSKNKLIRKGTDNDLDLSKDPKVKAKWYPTNQMITNSRLNIKAHFKVSDLFTQRALVGLSLILDEIESIKDADIRNIMELTFTGSLSQASKLVFVIRNRKGDKKSEKAEVGSWVVGYWIPNERFEINALNCFKNRFAKVLKGIEEINSLFPINNENATSFNELKQKNYFIKQGSATELPIPDETIDYVFIDPPHGNRVLYLEMSYMWNSWLKSNDTYELDNEIVQSESSVRNKNLNNYSNLFDESIKEIARVLKEGKYMSLAFNSIDDIIWLNVLNSCINRGFHIVKIEPLDYSARSVVQDNRKNALKTDFVITFVKNNTEKQSLITYNRNRGELESELNKILKNKGLELYEIINKLFKSIETNASTYPISLIHSMLEKNYKYTNGKWKLKEQED